jgi:hypothetical protein
MRCEECTIDKVSETHYAFSNGGDQQSIGTNSVDLARAGNRTGKEGDQEHGQQLQLVPVTYDCLAHTVTQWLGRFLTLLNAPFEALELSCDHVANDDANICDHAGHMSRSYDRVPVTKHRQRL